MQNKRIGFVPTMGALHNGHLSLIEESIKKNDKTVTSIFVNPTQFNDSSDLEKYPRTIEEDLEKLEKAGTDIVFLPSVEEMYPPELETKVNIDLGTLAEYMEGEHRPGHFDGVMQVVKRLLDIIEPNNLYMGQKDFQQWAIIRRMAEILNLDVEVVRCPIVREKDGLAMSSRNLRLSADARAVAPFIHQTLSTIKTKVPIMDLIDIKKEIIQTLSIPEFTIDYFEIADGRTLLPIKDYAAADLIVACTAVFVGGIRLIDNIIIKE